MSATENAAHITGKYMIACALIAAATGVGGYFVGASQNERILSTLESDVDFYRNMIAEYSKCGCKISVSPPKMPKPAEGAQGLQLSQEEYVKMRLKNLLGSGFRVQTSQSSAANGEVEVKIEKSEK